MITAGQMLPDLIRSHFVQVDPTKAVFLGKHEPQAVKATQRSVRVDVVGNRRERTPR
jgi:hypothetical protein